MITRIFMKRGKIVLSFISIFFVSLFITSGITFADSEVPSITSITFNGSVTVSGSSDPDGFFITARIDDWESQPATVGEYKSSKYHGLFVDAPKEYIGKSIEFWLQDQIVADQTATYLYINQDGSTDRLWTIPQLRQADLTFSSTPLPPTPTPTLVPTATPVPIILKPSYFEGRAISNGKAVNDGNEIYVVIDDYKSDSAVVFDGRYFLTVDPIFEKYLNQPVQFFIGNVSATQAEPFLDDVYRSDYLLVFPAIPEATPVPTALPSPTSTPLPTATTIPLPTKTPVPTISPSRTQTVTPIPTQTLTPTPTPTPLVDLSATVAAQNLLLEQLSSAQEESEGGFCSSTSGGSSSMGIIGLLMMPILLLLFRKFRKYV